MQKFSLLNFFFFFFLNESLDLGEQKKYFYVLLTNDPYSFSLLIKTVLNFVFICFICCAGNFFFFKISYN